MRYEASLLPPIVTAPRGREPAAGAATESSSQHVAAAAATSDASAESTSTLTSAVDPVATELRRWRANAVAEFAATRHRVRRWAARGDAASAERGEERPLPATTDIEGWRRVVDGGRHGPRLATILGMNQRQIVVLLEMNRRWLVDDGLPLTRGQGRWIYALLAGLER